MFNLGREDKGSGGGGVEVCEDGMMVAYDLPGEHIVDREDEATRGREVVVDDDDQYRWADNGRAPCRSVGSVRAARPNRALATHAAHTIVGHVCPEMESMIGAEVQQWYFN